jgi:hypothetical protein
VVVIEGIELERLRCDACGVGSPLECSPSWLLTNGWAVAGAEHVCPDCAAPTITVLPPVG